MRTGIVVALFCVIGCAPAVPPPHVLLADVDRDVDELVRAYPLEAGADFRKDQIGGTPGSTVFLVQVRGGESPHRHVTHDLAVTLLRGHGVLHIAGVELPMRAGDVAVIPRGVAHWYTNAGKRPSITLAVYTPALDAPDSVPVDAVDSRGGAR